MFSQQQATASISQLLHIITEIDKAHSLNCSFICLSNDIPHIMKGLFDSKATWTEGEKLKFIEETNKIIKDLIEKAGVHPEGHPQKNQSKLGEELGNFQLSEAKSTEDQLQKIEAWLKGYLAHTSRAVAKKDAKKKAKDAASTFGKLMETIDTTIATKKEELKGAWEIGVPNGFKLCTLLRKRPEAIFAEISRECGNISDIKSKCSDRIEPCKEKIREIQQKINDKIQSLQDVKATEHDVNSFKIERGDLLSAIPALEKEIAKIESRLEIPLDNQTFHQQLDEKLKNLKTELHDKQKRLQEIKSEIKTKSFDSLKRDKTVAELNARNQWLKKMLETVGDIGGSLKAQELKEDSSDSAKKIAEQVQKLFNIEVAVAASSDLEQGLPSDITIALQDIYAKLNVYTVKTVEGKKDLVNMLRVSTSFCKKFKRFLPEGYKETVVLEAKNVQSTFRQESLGKIEEAIIKRISASLDATLDSVDLDKRMQAGPVYPEFNGIVNGRYTDVASERYNTVVEQLKNYAEALSLSQYATSVSEVLNPLKRELQQAIPQLDDEQLKRLYNECIANNNRDPNIAAILNGLSGGGVAKDTGIMITPLNEEISNSATMLGFVGDLDYCHATKLHMIRKSTQDLSTAFAEVATIITEKDANLLNAHIKLANDLPHKLQSLVDSFCVLQPTELKAIHPKLAQERYDLFKDTCACRGFSDFF